MLSTISYCHLLLTCHGLNVTQVGPQLVSRDEFLAINMSNLLKTNKKQIVLTITTRQLLNTRRV